QKKDLRISSSNQKEYLELENRNQEEKEQLDRGNPGSYPRNQQKDLEKGYAKLNIKKHGKKIQSKSKKEAELDFFLKRYLLFQLRWNNLVSQ
ncbi:hypothetical protein DVA81_18470, partial [Acinetobacter baumannii]